MTSPLPLQHPRFAARVAPFVAAGVIELAAVHAVDLLADADHPEVLLGLAFAASAPLLGHVGVDLRTLRQAITLERPREEDPADGPEWPEDGQAWLDAVTASPLVGAAGPGVRTPFVREGALLLPHRYWDYQRRLAVRLEALATSEAPGAGGAPLCPETLEASLARLFRGASSSDLQRLSALVAAHRRLTIISGGPGTGKTYTVRNILALLDAQWRVRQGRSPRVALAAPTGKAAVRMREAILAGLDEGELFAPETVAWLRALTPSTLHRLLGFQPRNPTRFRHDASAPLPHEVVVVDEASMVDLAMMCKLIEAVGPATRLILLGDRNQLASVEAGSVLADITRDGRAALFSRSFLEAMPGAGIELASDDAPPLADCIVHFQRPYRTREGSGVQALAYAIADGDIDKACAWLRGAPGPEGVPFSDLAMTPHAGEALCPSVRRLIVDAHAGPEGYLSCLDAGPDGDPAHHREVLRRFDRLRVLTAHRVGPLGVEGLNALIERDLLRRHPVERRGPFWAGRPLMVTENSYELGVMNGDVGVVVPSGDGLRVAFPGTAEGTILYLELSQLPAHETVFAMTVHKSQGSEFAHTLLVLPTRPSPILTRELVYTGLTRARERITVCGDEATLRLALSREVRRASGLQALLWR